MSLNKLLKNKLIIFLLAILAFAIVGFIYIRFFYQPSENNGKNVVYTFEGLSHPFVSRLNGLPVTSAEEIAPQVLGVMIDNHPAARPQSGLNEARIVYEAPAEGGITRYLAIFGVTDTAERVGPVRSARPYYLDWLGEYGDGLYLHCGGSPEALRRIEAENIFDANEFYWGPYYWRASGLDAPHNLFTSSEKWQLLYNRYSAKHPLREWAGWKFGDPPPSSTSTEYLSQIKIPYGADYVVTWKYDAVSGMYERYINDRLHIDSNGQAIKAKNVIVQWSGVNILDNVGRREIDTTGPGEAKVFRDGLGIEAEWRKITAENRTRFYDKKTGAELSLAPGKIWIEIAPTTLVLEVAN